MVIFLRLIWLAYFIYLFEFSCHLQHCIGHIITGSFMGRRNQNLQLVKILYYKLLTIGKQLPTFSHRVLSLNHTHQSCYVCVLQLPHCGPRLEYFILGLIDSYKFVYDSDNFLLLVKLF